MTELAAVDDPPAVDEIPLIESDPDGETFPFRIAYRRDGDRIEETFAARKNPPFAFFTRLRELEIASAAGIPSGINMAVRRLLLVALVEESSTRLLRLIEGDEDEVGKITSEAIGGVVDVLRAFHYKSPTPRGSSNGRQRAARTSSAGRSGKASTSTRSRSKRV